MWMSKVMKEDHESENDDGRGLAMSRLMTCLGWFRVYGLGMFRV